MEIAQQINKHTNNDFSHHVNYYGTKIINLNYS